MRQAIDASLVPTQDYRHWWELELKDRLRIYLRANFNWFPHHRSGPWKDVKSDSALEFCVAYSFKLSNFDLSDNKSPDRFVMKLNSQGIKIKNLSKYLNEHAPADPADCYHTSVARGCAIDWDSVFRDNATPCLPQSRNRSDHALTHLSCMDDNVTLHVPETRPQEIELGSAETKLNMLLSTMNNERRKVF